MTPIAHDKTNLSCRGKEAPTEGCGGGLVALIRPHRKGIFMGGPYEEHQGELEPRMQMLVCPIFGSGSAPK